MAVERTSEERILGGLSHLAILFGWFGLVANVVLLLLYRAKSKFVAGHALQAIGLQVAVHLLTVLWAIYFAAAVTSGSEPSVAGTALYIFIGLAALVLAVQGAVNGFQGATHRYPLFGSALAGLLGESSDVG